MILKKFIGKTLDAAKKSARQMYGDDFVIIETFPEKKNKNAGITVFVDQKKNSGKKGTKQNHSKSRKERVISNGVKFERSDNGQSNKRDPGQNPNLQSLRRIAKAQIDNNGTNGSGSQSNDSLNSDEISPSNSFKPNIKNSNTDSHYSRASIRGNQPDLVKPDHSENDNGTDEDTEKEAPSGNEPNLSRFDRSTPKIGNHTAEFTSKVKHQEKQELSALHKRFDKLEALVDSALISSNLEYASHPAFQQLVQAGIGTAIVASWFSEIIRDGIDPHLQPHLFMSKLSVIIRNALDGKNHGEPSKYQLFVGPSGSGKTHLIMKLIQHPDFLLNKNIAVVSLMPDGNEKSNYYTVLEPYCNDRDLKYYKINSGAEVTEFQLQWEDYDHVLIDSPSVTTNQDNSFRQFWNIRQIFSPLTPLEVHYVINASLNRYYFQDSTAANHPLQPDFIAITHLDEASQWGPLIPFFRDMGCSSRYLSCGKLIPDSLLEFDPAWFAQKVLQDT